MFEFFLAFFVVVVVVVACSCCFSQSSWSLVCSVSCLCSSFLLFFRTVSHFNSSKTDTIVIVS